ncbi:MAG: metallophosphoesterase [Eubacteriales bacterium]
MSTKARLIDLAIIIVLLLTGLYRGPVTRNYNVESDKIQNEITIAVAADLHNQFVGEDQQKLIKRLEKAQPDIILMPGDMTNSPYAIDGMVSFMKQAAEIAPCYYVIGNHEYWSGEYQKILDIVEQTGVVVLRSEMTQLDIAGSTIELYGVDDWDANIWDATYKEKNWAAHLDEMWTENDENTFRILMSHRPERVEDYKEYEYDLIVSGHAHGGQVRIPFFLNGLYAPDQGWFPKYAGGEYQISDATTMIVSRGIYNYPNMPRIYNPSEIVIITISGNN